MAFRYLVSFVMILDLLIKFRSVILDTTSGQLIDEPKSIAKFYLKTFGFWVDLITAIPFFILLDFSNHWIFEFLPLLLTLKYLS